MASLSDPLVQKLLGGRYVTSLATEGSDGEIHVVAVWYCHESGCIYVATASRSRKARNLRSNPKISIMIDSRDPAASYGTTIAGTAHVLTGDPSREWNARIHRKYMSAEAIADPKVEPVFEAWDDVTIEITPRSVIAWDMREADREVFGGAIEKNPAYLLPTAR